jgi:hypothetical protein
MLWTCDETAGYVNLQLEEDGNINEDLVNLHGTK